MPGDKIFGSDFVDQSAHEEFKKLNEEADRLVKSFVEAAGGANAFREDLSKATGIKQTTDEIKKGRQELTEMEKLMRQLIQTTERISVLDSQRAKALAAVREEARLMNQANKEESKLLAAKEGSYEQLDLQLRQMVRSYKALSEAERNAARGTELLDKLQKTRAALGALDANMGNWQRNVGNYASATNGMTQVLRELPAFAVSFQTGILGISNNVHQVVDDFKRMRQEGKGAGEILGIFGKSMFSMTNLLSVGVGLFTIFSKQIFEYAKSLNAANKEQEELNKVLAAGEKDARAQVNAMERIYRTSQDVTLSIEERKKAVDKLQETYPAYFGNLSDEAILNGEAKDSYDQLRESILSAGRARALEAKIQEEINNDLDKEMQLRKDLQKATSDEMVLRGRSMKLTRRSGIDKEVVAVDISPEQADVIRIEKKAIAQKALNDFKEAQDARLRIYEDALSKERTIRDRHESKPSGASKSTKDSRGKTNAARKPDVKEWASEINALDREVQLMNEKADEEAIARVQKAIEEKKKLNAQYAKDELDLIQGNLNAMERMWDQADEEERNRIRERVAALDQYAQFAQQLEDLGQAVVDITFAREMSRLDERQRRLTEYYDTEKQRIDASFTNQADKEREMMKLEAQREAQQKKIDQDRRAAERKRAQAQKAFDIASIITSTSLAVIKAYTEGDPYTKIPRALAAAAAGAISLARAIATQIPAYAQGTENHPGGPAIVGDAGMELVQEPGGRSYLTPNSPVIMDLPKKTKVIPHDELMQRVWNTAYVKMAGSGKVTTDSMAAAMIGAFEEMTDEIRGVRKAVSNIGVNVTLRDDSRAMAHIKSRVC